MPAGEPHGLVFLFSDQTGPNARARTGGAALAGLGLIVAPVDLPAFLRQQDTQSRECLYLVSDIEEASRRIQALGGRGHYLTPIVAGTGMGAAVAYAALAQAPDATLAGAASDGFATRVTTVKPLCAGAPVEPAADGGFELRPVSPFPGWWRVAPAAGDAKAAARVRRRSGRRRRRGGATRARRRAGRSPRPSCSRPRWPRRRMAASPACRWSSCRSTGAGRQMAVVYSGDGGWRDIDKDIAGRLQASGIPVVGVDSLRYFWSEKTPEQTAGRPRHASWPTTARPGSGRR